MAEQQKPSPNLVVELTHAVERTEMLYNAAQLRLFDVLARLGQPVTASRLTQEINLAPETSDKLDRLLNACAVLGMLERTVSPGSKEALYDNTADSAAYLTTGSDLSLLPLVDASRHQFDFADAIKENKWDLSRTWFFRPQENAHAYKEIPHRFRRYYFKQEGYARTSIHLLEAFDLSSYKTVVDLGGGLGSVSRALKRLHPNADVTCYDMPQVVEFARDIDRERGLPNDICYVAGDALGCEPLPRADLYIVGHLLHMFDDDLCQTIVSKVAQALNEGGAVLVLEKVMTPARDGPELCLMYDVRVNNSASKGKERTLGEYRQLLTDGGFDGSSLQPFINEGYNIYDAMLCNI